MRTFLLLCVAATAAAKSAFILPDASPYVKIPAKYENVVLKDADIATVVSRILDLPAEAPTAALPSGNIFQRPSSVALFSVDGLSLAEAQMLGLENLTSGTALPVDIVEGSDPAAMMGAAPEQLTKRFDDAALVRDNDAPLPHFLPRSRRVLRRARALTHHRLLWTVLAAALQTLKVWFR
jgi:hypothetical protein